MEERKRAAILARMAKSGGAHVVCLGCGARGRHQVGGGTRLRDKRCARCSTKHPRLVRWVTANPEKAAQESALARLGIFETTTPAAY